MVVGEAWPSSSSEAVTRGDAEKKKDARKRKENAERRGLTNGTGHGREVANEISYRRGEKEKRERGGG